MSVCVAGGGGLGSPMRQHQHQQQLAVTRPEHVRAASKLHASSAPCTCVSGTCLLLQDVNKDPGAEDTFKKIGEAYEVSDDYTSTGALMPLLSAHESCTSDARGLGVSSSCAFA